MADRDQTRKWSRADHKLAQSNALLLTHVEPIRAYVHIGLKSVDLLETIIRQGTANDAVRENYGRATKEWRETTNSALFHEAAIDNQELANTLGKFQDAYLELQASAVKNLETGEPVPTANISPLVTAVLVAAARVTHQLDKTIVDSLDDQT